MLKLLNVDAAGERALRVVAYFDQLGSNKPDFESVVRATALIADCPAGLQLPDRGLFVRFAPEGTMLGTGGRPSVRAPLATDSGEGGTVWLERDGDALELDEFIVERFALTASAVIDRERPNTEFELAHGFSDPALAQLLVNERASEAERSRAAQLMGLQAGSSVQLVALEPDADDELEDLPVRLRNQWLRPTYLAELSRHLILLVVVTREPIDWAPVDLKGRGASGPIVDVLDAPRSWTGAREALRFAGAGASWPRLLNADSLGVIQLLGKLDSAVVGAHPDVARIEHVAAAPNGAESILVLDHFLHADSVRAAAREVNYHHSSLQTRVKRIGELIGIDLTSASGRERAALALLLWRTFRSGT